MVARGKYKWEILHSRVLFNQASERIWGLEIMYEIWNLRIIFFVYSILESRQNLSDDDSRREGVMWSPRHHRCIGVLRWSVYTSACLDSACTSLLVSQLLSTLFYVSIYTHFSSHSTKSTSVWVLSGFCHDFEKCITYIIIGRVKREKIFTWARTWVSWALNAESKRGFRSGFRFLWELNGAVYGVSWSTVVESHSCKHTLKGHSDRMREQGIREFHQTSCQVCRTEF